MGLSLRNSTSSSNQGGVHLGDFVEFAGNGCLRSEIEFEFELDFSRVDPSRAKRRYGYSAASSKDLPLFEPFQFIELPRLDLGSNSNSIFRESTPPALLELAGECSCTNPVLA